MQYFKRISIIMLFIIGCSNNHSETNRQQTPQIKSSNKYTTSTKNKKELEANKSLLKPLVELHFDKCDIKDGKIFADHTKNYDAKAYNKIMKSQGIINNGIKFDGKDSYLQFSTMDIDYSSGFTFSAWVKFDNKAGEGKNWETIFSFGNDDRDKEYEDKHKYEIWLNRYYKENRLYFAFTNGDRDNLCSDVKTVQNVITPNKFQLITVTIDKKGYTHIFIDAKEVKTEVAWHNKGGACKVPNIARELCYIGKANDEWIGFDKDGGTHDHKDNNLFKGSIDEVLIFNKELKESQIQDIYKKQKSGKNLDNSVRKSIECHIKPSPKPKPTPKPKRQNATIKSYADENYIYFEIDTKGIKSPKAIIFIDADNNPKTGHQANDWSKQSGADYAIGMAGKLYIAKTDDRKWEWDATTLDMAKSYSIKNGIIKIKVDRLDFAKLQSSYRVGARVFINKKDSIATPKDNLLSIYSNKIKHDRFSTIRSVLNQENSTYISVGDSTRAENDIFKNYYVFRYVKQSLGEKVNSILQAVAGHSAKEWSEALSYPTWRDTVTQIPNNGSTTVVNISLGINDSREFHSKKELKNALLAGIKNILKNKPQTHILLTMPNLMIGEDSSIYVDVYRELSSRYPMIDTYDLFSSYDLSLYRQADSQRYGDGIYIHLSQKGQKLLSQRILSKLQ